MLVAHRAYASLNCDKLSRHLQDVVALWLQSCNILTGLCINNNLPLTRDPAQVSDHDLKERPLADSAEESPYIHPASKSRFGSQHKGIRSGQLQLDDGISDLQFNLLVLGICKIQRCLHKAVS